MAPGVRRESSVSQRGAARGTAVGRGALRTAPGAQRAVPAKLPLSARPRPRVRWARAARPERRPRSSRRVWPRAAHPGAGCSAQARTPHAARGHLRQPSTWATLALPARMTRSIGIRRPGAPPLPPPRPPTPRLPSGASWCHVTPPPGGPSALLADAPFRLPGPARARPPRAAEGGKSHGICHLSLSPSAPPRALIYTGPGRILASLSGRTAGRTDGAALHPAQRTPRGPWRGRFPWSPSWPRRRRARAASPEFQGSPPRRVRGRGPVAGLRGRGAPGARGGGRRAAALPRSGLGAAPGGCVGVGAARRVRDGSGSLRPSVKLRQIVTRRRRLARASRVPLCSVRVCWTCSK